MTSSPCPTVGAPDVAVAMVERQQTWSNGGFRVIAALITATVDQRGDSADPWDLDVIGFDDLEMDAALFELRRGGSRVPMEPQTFDVLAYLVTHRDRVVSKAELMDAVWGGRFVSESAVTSRIKQARRAVGDDGHAQRVIRTVHRRGYRFVAKVGGGLEGAPAS